jgi:hypothetical protein
MDQPYPPSGEPAAPGRPPAPVPVLTAARLMYTGAAVSALTVIISLALIPAVKAALVPGPRSRGAAGQTRPPRWSLRGRAAGAGP